MPWPATRTPCFRLRRRTRSRCECGSCLVQVSVLSGKRPIGTALTEKEKTVLRYAGKITAEQIANAETNDIPPPWRLACQMVVRDEDILVKF